jgi:hypothetical protein
MNEDNKNKSTIGQQFKQQSYPLNTNIEKILIKAARDEKFREKLLKDRESVCNKEEFSLNRIDKMLLTTIPLEKLESMIDNFIRQYTTRRNFLKGIKTTAAALAGVFIVSNISCCQGSRPDQPQLTETVGPEGATINHNFNKLQIIIPAGSVDKEVNISIDTIKTPAAPPDNVHFTREIYNLTGNIINFKKEITLKFSVYGKNDRIGVYSYEKSKWEKVSSEFIEPASDQYFILVKTKTPGIYTVGYIEILTPEFPRITIGIRG